MFTIAEVIVRNSAGEEKRVRKLFGTGRLTNDPPAVIEIQNGHGKVLRGNKDHRFSIAFTDPSLGRDEHGRLKTKFYPVVAWDKTAELLAKLGFKGQPIEVVGRIEKRTNGDKEFETLVIERFEVKQYKKQNDSGQTAQAAETDSGQTAQAAETPSFEGASEVIDDDIPF